MLAVVVIALAGGGLALVWFGQRSQIYQPDRSAVVPAARVIPGGQDVVVTTSDGLDLGGWYAPATGTCRAAVLVAAGNGGNREARAGLLRAIRARGFGVLLVDYRGYGGNPGRPSEAGLVRDLAAGRAYLLDHAGIPPEGLVYLGESLGTGVVSDLALRHPPAAMVLRSPMTSFAAVVRALYHVPVGWILRDAYPVQQNVARLDVPLAVVYGDADSLVPPGQSRAVARSAREAGASVIEAAVPRADHNDAALSEGETLVGALVRVAGLAGITGCG